MALGVLDSQYLTDIANAIREKSGTTALIKPTDMASAIKEIPTGDNSKFQSMILRDITEITADDLSGIDTIGDYAFAGCHKLRDVDCGDVRYIGVGAFMNSGGFNEIKLSKVEGIGNKAFETTSLYSVDIPSTCEEIGNYAFGLCIWLESVTIRATSMLYGIASDAFADSGVTNIYCAFSEGAVEGAPWGAETATIHYDYTD